MYEQEQQFGLTDHETLWYRVSHKRFMELLAGATVLNCEEGTNNYGEWLFVTLERDGVCVTFYGLGFHEQREVYSVDVWHFYRSEARYYPGKRPIHHQVLRQIDARRTEYKNLAEGHRQPESGWLFSIVADLTDDDYASTLDLDFGLDLAD